jgi:hypothetical protein
VEKCRESEKHRGPFFTVTVVARQAGRGSRRGGKERLEYRHVLGRVCRKCLRSCMVKARGKNLLRRNASRVTVGKVAVPRPENETPAMGTAWGKLRAANGGEPLGNRDCGRRENGVS